MHGQRTPQTARGAAVQARRRARREARRESDETRESSEYDEEVEADRRRQHAPQRPAHDGAPL
jgi:hypothetical protein